MVKRPLITCRMLMQVGPFDPDRYTAVQHAIAALCKKRRSVCNTGVSKHRLGSGWVGWQAEPVLWHEDCSSTQRRAVAGCAPCCASARQHRGCAAPSASAAWPWTPALGNPGTALSTLDVTHKPYSPLSAARPCTPTQEPRSGQCPYAVWRASHATVTRCYSTSQP